MTEEECVVDFDSAIKSIYDGCVAALKNCDPDSIEYEYCFSQIELYKTYFLKSKEHRKKYGKGRK